MSNENPTKPIEKWFTRYTTRGEMYFQKYVISVNGVATLPVSHLVDCDMLISGFNFDYEWRHSEEHLNGSWERVPGPEYVRIKNTVPQHFTEFSGENRASLYLSNRAGPKTTMRVKEIEPEIFIIHKDDLETFWGDNWESYE